MSYAFDEIVSSLSPNIPPEAQRVLKQIGQQIINDVRRDIRILINEMKFEQLEARKPEQPSTVYNINIGENRGPVQQGGTGNTQSNNRSDDEVK